MKSACTVCGSPLDHRAAYRGVCLSCASRAIASRPDLGPYASAAAAFAKIARLRRIGLAVGGTSVLAWVLNGIVLSVMMKRDAGFNALIGAWIAFGGVQVALAITAGTIIVRARAASKQLGVRPFGAGPAILFFLLGGIGFIGSFGIPALFAVAAVLLGGGWGRPLRVGRRGVTPRVRPANEWAKGPHPDVTTLSGPTRDALTELWLHDAKKEHASVPAFAQVAWQLAALGAPADLLARANRSALQEIDHAQRCFALAGTYARTEFGHTAMPELAAGMGALPRSRVRALVAVARETLVEGAFIEGYNAALARVGLEDATDPAARETLERIAVDEAAHAELAWDILAFCLDAGGAPVVRALTRAARSFGDLAPAPYRPEHLGLVALADPAALREHGRVRPDAWAPTYAACRAETLERLEQLFAMHARSNMVA
ncbi:ferritin-like domain-containing protein [Pendulispora albinea]|uniref:Ferritin-like domain-containing protein n=1 Tax=Pendulispora albinea TaxID=2741071 RepID=A0ABZ2LLE4_9BACT